MKPQIKFRIWLIKKLAGDIGIVLNLNAVSFKPQYNGQPIYGGNVDMEISKTDKENVKKLRKWTRKSS